ncbi:MAG: Crp/Fnr family transcriptional regulator [Sphingobacterium sp.]|jgi:CRP-like cAMP-binding protein|uniref:Crp/Fnr family transcriptional regulator n=1 Tax=unclassified Sphingobacterium TaxID=2609468 RepID=UPI00284A842A|nr:Crp/Fnr family transcriptional regulator [Sphingobacterium sp.]MDR3008807.1 Crp/Fnr family transcriptional regulator [Sphingobacterium sp.]
MMKRHLKKINALIENFDVETELALQSVSKTKKYKKGEFLLYQGEICKSSFWIEEGITRKYYMNDKKEVTTELLFKHDLAVAFSSYVSNQPSLEFIQAITDVTVSCIDKNSFRNIKENHPHLIQLDLLMTEYYAMWLEKRLFEFHTLNAIDRYKLLLLEQPDFIRHIPLTYIASYLGISLETLSRVRTKI